MSETVFNVYLIVMRAADRYMQVEGARTKISLSTKTSVSQMFKSQTDLQTYLIHLYAMCTHFITEEPSVEAS
jgi:hypothetical protein